MDPVTHFEIPYTDKGRAQKFYREVFGWEFVEVPDMDYAMAITTPTDGQRRPTQPGAINGGMYKRGDYGSHTPVVVLRVPSCAQRLREAQAAGGTVVFGPQQVGDMGIYAQIKDPEDNVIGLWQSLRPAT